MKETRKMLKSLNAVKTLSSKKDADDGDEDTLAWVAKMRKKDEAKRKADEKAKLLEEMDEEFGVSELLSEVMGTDKQEYGSRDLQGIKVEHDTSAFKDGRDITLVIKDTDILDESEPVLYNMNLFDAEKAVKNVELKKGKPGYNPYESEDVDEFGNVKQTSLLNKYDEEIFGERKKMFVLGEDGTMDAELEKEREIVRQRLAEKSITLSTGPSQIASEYYSTEEMVAFKKPKKKKKIRKKVKVKADDLVPLDTGEDKKDHGSRRQHHPDDIEVDNIPQSTGGIDLMDETDATVSTALMRTRRLLQMPKASLGESTGAAKVASLLQQVKKEEETVSKFGPAIVLDKTTEFCKQVGGDEQEDIKDVARRKSSTDYPEDHIDEEDMEAENEDDEDDEGGWKEVKEHTKKKEKPKIDDLYQEAEPMLTAGVSGAIKLASKKGFVDSSVQERKSENVDVVTSVGRRDVEYERQKERERDRELSRYGRESSFPEKKNYNPNVSIEYVDDAGRLMTTKEAFRFMSHKFHGRTSGRKKMDKRLKKLQEERLLNSASSTDTPLNTLSVLQSKQKSAQSPYILISGGAQSLLAPDIAKRK